MIAKALVRGPRLLVLENPFMGLDTAFRTKLRRIIGKVMKKQAVVILVTTRAAEIPDSATHVLRVDHNRVVAQGPKKDILRCGVRGSERGPTGSCIPGTGGSKGFSRSRDSGVAEGACHL